MNGTRFTFKKEEKLTGKKLIDELFEKGSSFYLQPFKIFFLEKTTSLKVPEEKTFPVRILISVSTKYFRRAVDRNKIKRLIREAYRLNKHVLYHSLSEGHDFETKNKQLILAILYTSKTIESFNYIQKKILTILNKLAEQNFISEKLNT